MTAPAVGSIGWLDLTVDDAPGLRDFYSAVVGWTPAEVPMGSDRYAVLRDPAGAAFALWQKGT